MIQIFIRHFLRAIRRASHKKEIFDFLKRRKTPIFCYFYKNRVLEWCDTKMCRKMLTKEDSII